MNQFNFPDQISGFSRVEYLSIFIALLYAFAIAEFFIGWGKMLRLKDQMVFSMHHLVWSFIFFWGSILNWYGLWQRIPFIDRGFLYFVLLLLPILLFFFSTIFLFPDFDKIRDLKVYYEKNKKTIILLFSVTLFINVLIGIILNEFALLSPVNIIRTVISFLGIAAAALNLKRLQDVLVYIFFISIIMGTFILSVDVSPK